MKKLLLLAMGLGLTATLVSQGRITQAEIKDLVGRIHPLVQAHNIKELEKLKKEALSKKLTDLAKMIQMAIDRLVETQEAALARSAIQLQSPAAKPTLTPTVAPDQIKKLQDKILQKDPTAKQPLETKPAPAKTGPPPMPEWALHTGPPPIPEGALTPTHAFPPAPSVPPYPVSGPPAPPTETKPRRSPAGPPKDVFQRMHGDTPVSPAKSDDRGKFLEEIKAGVRLKKTQPTTPKSRRPQSYLERALAKKFEQALPQEDDQDDEQDNDEDWQ